jgi:hypothetical protein
MRRLAWVAGAIVLFGCGFAACASGDDPGTSFNDDTGPGPGVGGGGGNGGASGEGGDDGPNGPSGPSPSSVTSVTSTSGPTGGSTSTGTSSGTPTSSSTGEPPCQDQGPGEPGNDTIDGAYDLGTISDSDDQGGQVTGNLREPGDVDWYKYIGEDTSFNSVDPFRQTVGAGIRTCMFVECIEGDTELECPSATVPATEGAISGCCWNGSIEVNIGGFNCSGPISDDSTVYMKIEHPDGPGCESYTVNYHY